MGRVFERGQSQRCERKPVKGWMEALSELPQQRERIALIRADSLQFKVPVGSWIDCSEV
jgi:hypothetical protein